MKLEVGKMYLRRDGVAVRVTGTYHKNQDWYTCTDLILRLSNGCMYTDVTCEADIVIECPSNEPMTERERWRYTFAGQAMQGMLAQGADEVLNKGGVAFLAASLADELLTELEKKA